MPPLNFLSGRRQRTDLSAQSVFLRRFLSLSGLMLPLAAAHATTRVVDSATDTATPGHTTLREAIGAAAAGDTIEFAPALFAGSLPVTIKLGSSLVVAKSLMISGPGDGSTSHVPRLLLEGSGADRILEIRSPSVVTVTGTGFQKGKAAGG